MEFKGLTAAEVIERKKKGLGNNASGVKTKTVSGIIIENLFSVFNIIIFAVVVFLLYFHLKTGDRRLLMDCFGVSIVAIINTIIAIFQEIKAKIALDKVSLMLQKSTTVIRDSKEETIDNKEIVQDDLIILKRGDQVIADGKILFSNKIEIDESLITGESEHLSKKENDQLFSGSFCVSGNGMYLAEKIGDECYANSITSLAKKYKFNVSPLQQKINLIVKFLFITAIVLVVLELIFGRAASYSEVHLIRKIASILIALIPQGLVLMVSVIYAIGIYRISKIGAIIEKLNAVEAFSSIKIICMDKTGTITKNTLAVTGINYFPGETPEDSIKNILAFYSSKSSERNETIRAISSPGTTIVGEIIDELPFSSDLKFSAVSLSLPGLNINNKTFVLGAFDILIDYTSPDLKIKPEEVIRSKNLSDYRNLLFGKLKNKIPLENLGKEISKSEIIPLAVVSINDQVRLDAADTIKEFKVKGIEFKILSGDSAGSIRSILRELDWDVSENEIITGNELDLINDDDFFSIIRHKIVFARLQPQQKLRIIKSLRMNKIFTAMIGDGVNDIPAIKESDVGIAMEEGSKSTKEIADIVLLKNKFSLLPEIFNEGNKILNTAGSVSKLFLTKNFMVIFITLFTLLFPFEFPLTPTRISLFNIFAIGLPAFLIASINKDNRTVKYFFSEVISYVIISSLVIVVFGYLGVYIAKNYFLISRTDVQLMLLAILLLVSFANFFVIISNSPKPEWKIYITFIIIFSAINVFFAAVHIHTRILTYLKDFYDVDYIERNLWLIIIPVSLTASLVLWGLQLLRRKILQASIK
jgi:cation-transporting ATPase E